jgi:hypothetical protein
MPVIGDEGMLYGSGTRRNDDFLELTILLVG